MDFSKEEINDIIQSLEDEYRDIDDNLAIKLGKRFKTIETLLMEQIVENYRELSKTNRGKVIDKIKEEYCIYCGEYGNGKGCYCRADW